jgi:catechol 2,3-dioxygenase-like lactoylglutathione lyase family enzyme
MNGSQFGGLTRREFLVLTGAATLAGPTVLNAQDAAPIVSRIKYATMGAPDVDAVERAYTEWLGYRVVEKTRVSTRMAKAWGTPNAAGRPFVLMRPPTGEDVLIRAVETEPVAGYKAMTTWGWNSFEIIVNDVDDLHERLLKSPFRHIGGPANLRGGTSSIRASQYIGPAEEVLYFNCETGDRSKSPLPDPGEDVGRTNIVILAGPDVEQLMTFYQAAFGLAEVSAYPTSIGVIADAQGLPEDTSFKLGFTWLREPGNAIEFDEYPKATTARPRAEGQLPQGNAMITFNVDSLDGVGVEYVSEPITEYGGKRSAVFVGPAGELVELIEDPRPA